MRGHRRALLRLSLRKRQLTRRAHHGEANAYLKNPNGNARNFLMMARESLCCGFERASIRVPGDERHIDTYRYRP